MVLKKIQKIKKQDKCIDSGHDGLLVYVSCRFKYDLCIVENVRFLSALFGLEQRIYIICDEYSSVFIYSWCLVFYNILGPYNIVTYLLSTDVLFLWNEDCLPHTITSKIVHWACIYIFRQDFSALFGTLFWPKFKW